MVEKRKTKLHLLIGAEPLSVYKMEKKVIDAKQHDGEASREKNI